MLCAAVSFRFFPLLFCFVSVVCLMFLLLFPCSFAAVLLAAGLLMLSCCVAAVLLLFACCFCYCLATVFIAVFLPGCVAAAFLLLLLLCFPVVVLLSCFRFPAVFLLFP